MGTWIALRRGDNRLHAGLSPLMGSLPASLLPCLVLASELLVCAWLLERRATPATGALRWVAQFAVVGSGLLLFYLALEVLPDWLTPLPPRWSPP